MKKSFEILISGLLALSMAACSSTDGGSASGGDSGSSETAAATTAAAETTAKNEMVIGIGAQFDTLDPALSTTVYNAYVISHVYAGLFDVTTEGTTELNMAKDYEMSEDGLEYTFYLRDDCTFNDGTPVKAENYEYAWLRAMSYGADNAFRVNNMVQALKGGEAYQAKALEAGTDFDCTVEDHSEVGIEVIDDYTIKVTLNYPIAYFPIWLGAGVWSALPLDTPQHTSNWSLEPGYATSGPYTLDYISVNDKAIIKKNDSYFKADEIKMGQITFQVMPDVDAQALAFQSGDIDVALSVSSETALSYKGTDNLWSLFYPSAYGLVINCGEMGPDWAKDVRVRKALYMALDKESIVEVIGGADMYPLISGWVPFGMGGIDGDFREERDKEGYELGYDPDGAKALLAEAGYDESNPLHITYKYSTNSFHGDIATMLQQYWSAIGIECEFDAVESGVYYGQIDDGNIEIGRYGLQSSDSPLSFLDVLTTDKQVVSLANDPVFDQMVHDVKYIADYNEFTKELHNIEDYVVQENMYIIPMFQFAQSALVQSNLKGNELHITTLWFGGCYFE